MKTDIQEEKRARNIALYRQEMERACRKTCDADEVQDRARAWARCMMAEDMVRTLERVLLRGVIRQ